MAHSFDSIIPRVGKDALKWDAPRDPKSPLHSAAQSLLPMWIADMDFATPDCVLDAVRARMEHPILGYFDVPERYYTAIDNWHKTRYGSTTTLTKQEVSYQNSVLGGIASVLHATTQPGEKILVHAATYVGFQHTIRGAGRTLCTSELLIDEQGIYRMDFADMEAKIQSEKISTMIFCSPHNPSGRVWERWEIEAVVALCDKYEVVLISDEIWADFITDPARAHIPTQSVSARAKEITAAFYAPSKTFNIAGLVGAYSVIYNRQLAQKTARAATASHYNCPNILSCYALIGGYEHGAEWVDALNAYVRANQEYVVDYLTTHFKGVHARVPQGTYLLWVDVSECGQSFEEIFAKLRTAGVLPNNGRDFFGKAHLRFNLACPRSICEEAMARLHSVFEPLA